MTKKKSPEYFSKHISNVVRFWVALIFLFAIAFHPRVVFAETGDGEDELSVNLNVKGIGSSEIPAMYREQEIYLSVIDVFDFLKIKNSYTESLDSIKGFLIDEKAQFLIDKGNNKINYQGKDYQLKQGELIRSDGKLYLKAIYFGTVFGLQCTFDFRNLSVSLNTDLELPVIREMRQELMRKNVNKLKGEEVADTTVGRKYPMATFGMADWSVINTHTNYGTSDIRMSLGFGAILAGGETNVAFTYDTRNKLTPRDQYYLWRYVNNDNKIVRQTLAGKVQPQFTSSVYSPAVGLQLTNTATTFRRSFGTYTLSNTTYPGWIVELYVNNVLISFVKADASGFYTFQVPLVYGNSSIKLRFYGPYGEERALEEFVNIPFNFIPAGQFEYNVSAGFLEDGFHSYTSTQLYGDSLVEKKIEGKANSIFTRARFNYGLNRFITVGGGVEYLSSVTSGTTMPFINTSVRITPTLMVTAEYTDKVVTKGVLTYRLPSNLQFELNYAVFDKDQTAIRHNYREQRKAIVSLPFNGKHFSAYSRISVDQIVLANSNYTTAEWLLSGSVRRVSVNVSTYSLFIGDADPLVYSNLSLGIRIPKQIVITPQVQYEYTQSDIISMKLTIEKKIKRFGLINAFYEENIQSHFNFFGLGVRLDLSFAQVGALAVQTRYATTYTENANGSFIYSHNQREVYANNKSSVGKGGLIIAPFLDLNRNGKKEDDEPRAAGLKLNINGGRLENNPADTIFQVFDLEPFTSYYLKFQDESFANISWSLRNKSMKVMIDANNLKLIELPVIVAAEISGTVYVNEVKESNGQGKIVVLIYDQDSNLVARTMSESDGYFSFMGLQPGNYTAKIDPGQLHKLQLVSEPAVFPFTIERSIEGDLVDGVEFNLFPEKPTE